MLIWPYYLTAETVCLQLALLNLQIKTDTWLCSNLFLLPVFVIAVIPSPGLDQSHVSPLNPFLTPGPPAFSFSPFGNYNI